MGSRDPRPSPPQWAESLQKMYQQPPSQPVTIQGILPDLRLEGLAGPGEKAVIHLSPHSLLPLTRRAY